MPHTLRFVRSTAFSPLAKVPPSLFLSHEGGVASFTDGDGARYRLRASVPTGALAQALTPAKPINVNAMGAFQVKKASWRLIGDPLNAGIVKTLNFSLN